MSSEAAIKLAELMISRSPFLRERCKDIAQYTDPDCPLPVNFHGEIGWQIAKDYDALPAWERAEISALIESGLASSDDMSARRSRPD